MEFLAASEDDMIQVFSMSSFTAMGNYSGPAKVPTHSRSNPAFNKTSTSTP
ncbi:uncharacterized protein FFE2_09672 [Fusarium fujikuroi]|nr:uncharacterized protein FFE2_09672 [Fusarium fujikuroi]